jgi:hypothetical protein
MTEPTFFLLLSLVINQIRLHFLPGKDLMQKGRANEYDGTKYSADLCPYFRKEKRQTNSGCRGKERINRRDKNMINKRHWPPDFQNWSLIWRQPLELWLTKPFLG